ncbi:MAG TPA: hypothetical protein VG245_03140, partial [Candidatus Dormibacteraeota bacterium]|nr:hypothetical protein [Candidatus Dormibacteraeota bacterium]
MSADGGASAGARATGPADGAAAADGPRPGLSFEVTREVTVELSAAHLGSGSVGVLATPAMILLMETAARQAVQPSLPDGSTTVG